MFKKLILVTILCLLSSNLFAQTAIRVPSLEVLVGSSSVGKRVEQLDLPGGIFTGTSSGKRVTISTGDYISKIHANGTDTIGVLDVVVTGDGTSTLTYSGGDKRGTLTVNITASAKPDIYEGSTIVGTESSRISFDADDFILSQSGGTSSIRFQGREIFVGTNSTWVVPTGITKIYLDIEGAGGGGGSGSCETLVSRRGGGGGGSGQIITGVAVAVTAGQSVVSTIGLPGSGGLPQTSASTNGNNGTDGGNTSAWVNTVGTITAQGGKAGGGGVIGGNGNAGNPGNDLINFGGSEGLHGGTATSFVGGVGGVSRRGGNAIAGGADGGGNGTTSAFYGSGGSGGGAGDPASGHGGTGTAGYVKIYY